MNRKKNITKNSIYELLNRFLNVIGEFVIRAIIIKVLGEEFLGINGLFSSILVLLNIAEMGFGSAMVYSMYKPIAEEDIDKLNALLLLYRRVYLIIGCCVLIVGCGISPLLPYFINGTYPNSINIYFVYYIYLINSVSAYFFGAYRASLFIADQKSRIPAIVKCIAYFITSVVQCVILLKFKSYTLYIIILPLYGISKNIVSYLLSIREYPNIKPKGKLEKNELKEIKQRVMGMSVYQIGGAIYSYADTLIISANLGLITLAKYSNYFYIITGLNAISESIMNAIIPSIGNSVATESIEKNLDDFYKINRASILLSIWASTCLVCLYQPFMELWMGKDMLFPNYMLAVFGLYFYTLNSTRAVSIYKNAAGIWWEDHIRPIIGIIVNIILSLLLVKTMGVFGVILATIITNIFINIPWASYYLFKVYFKRSYKKLLLSQIYGLLLLAIIVYVSYFICNLFTYKSLVIQLISNLIVSFLVNIFLVFFYLIICKCKNKINNNKINNN